MVLVPEQLVGHAVVARVHHDEDVIAPHRILDQTLGVAALEAGALAGDDEAAMLHAALCGPPHQVTVDQVGQFLRTGAAQQTQICDAAALRKDILGFDHIGHFYGSFNSSLPVLCLFHTKRIMPFSFYHILAALPAGFSKFCALHSSYAKIRPGLSVIYKTRRRFLARPVLTSWPEPPSAPRCGRCSPSGRPDPPGPCGRRRPACGRWACAGRAPG